MRNFVRLAKSPHSGLSGQAPPDHLDPLAEPGVGHRHPLPHARLTQEVAYRLIAHPVFQIQEQAIVRAVLEIFGHLGVVGSIAIQPDLFIAHRAGAAIDRRVDRIGVLGEILDRAVDSCWDFPDFTESSESWRWNPLKGGGISTLPINI